MITTESLLAGLQRETDIIKHLATKVPEERLDWRATKSQRSLGELLQYLVACAIPPAYAMVQGDWERGKAVEEELRADYTFASFAGCMDAQMERLRVLLADLTAEEALSRTVQLPWGEEVPLGVALIETVWKCFTTYRTTLFLFAKEAGASELCSTNLWMGRDPAPAQA